MKNKTSPPAKKKSHIFTENFVFIFYVKGFIFLYKEFLYDKQRIN